MGGDETRNPLSGAGVNSRATSSWNLSHGIGNPPSALGKRLRLSYTKTVAERGKKSIITGLMLSIDYWMPAYDFVERHETRAQAEAYRVYQSIRAADFGHNFLFKSLLGLRALPQLALDPARVGKLASGLSSESKLTLDTFFQNGFALLEERDGQEMVIGLTGRFWLPTGAIVRTEPTEFRQPRPEGVAKAAWNFVVGRAVDGSSTLVTETRVWCPDTTCRRSFGAYWMFIRPFSGLLRRIMLKEIKRIAERQSNRFEQEIAL